MLKFSSSKLILAALFFVALISGYSQSAPSATLGGIPLVVGGGFSSFDIGFSNIRLTGPSLWADVDYYGTLRRLQGFGIEMEARDLTFGKPGDYAGNLRQATAMGGVVYKWRDFHKIRPYGKFLLGYGKMQFAAPAFDPYYTSDSRTTYAPGFGLDYRIDRNILVRADYEYQLWPGLFGEDLHPQGFTFGVSYDFKTWNSR
jgi:opacity protein-like surface antigen